MSSHHHSPSFLQMAPSSSSSSSSSTNVPDGQGTYKVFSDHALQRLLSDKWFQKADIPTEMQSNVAPAKGMPEGSTVRITNHALIPSTEAQELLQYARVALLETIVPTEQAGPESTTTTTAGIQVLNLLVIPANTTTLPALGIDLVSLPGNRHLLLLDAQPMVVPGNEMGSSHDENWKGWYHHYVQPHVETTLPWGGDFPDAVKPYVSSYSLWTRLQEQEDPVSIIQSTVFDAFVAHIDVYMDLLKSSASSPPVGANHQTAYLDYRRSNDPAKPMLKSLYGADWTQRLLDEILFPIK